MLLLACVNMVSKKAKKFFDDENWSVFLEVISPLQKTILIAIGRSKASAESLSFKLFSSANTIGSILHSLEKFGALEKIENGVYRISNLELAKYCDSLKLRDSVILKEEEIIAKVSNDVYKTTVKLFESLEHLGYLRGNGHHKAQKIAEFAVDEFLESKNVDKLKKGK